MRSVASGLHEFGELALQRHVVPHVELFYGCSRQSSEDGDQVQFSLGLISRDFLRREHVGDDRATDRERCDLLAPILDGGAQFEFSRLICHRRSFSISSIGKYRTVHCITIRSECHLYSWVDVICSEKGKVSGSHLNVQVMQQNAAWIESLTIQHGGLPNASVKIAETVGGRDGYHASGIAYSSTGNGQRFPRRFTIRSEKAHQWPVAHSYCLYATGTIPVAIDFALEINSFDVWRCLTQLAELSDNRGVHQMHKQRFTPRPTAWSAL